MIDFIKSDFECEHLETIDSYSLFIKINPITIHFLVYNEEYKYLMQTRIHKLEFISMLSDYKLLQNELSTLLPSIIEKHPDIEISQEKPNESTLKVHGYSFPFDIKSDLHSRINQLLSDDIKKYKSIVELDTKEIFHSGEVNNEATDKSAPKMNLVNVELTDLKRVKLYESKLIAGDNTILNKFIDSNDKQLSYTYNDPFGDFLNTFTLALVNKNCDCGDNNCFFPILKTAVDKYFTQKNLVVNNEINEDALIQAINLAFDSLTNYQQSAFLTVNQFLQNTPLIAFYFVSKGADITELTRLLTVPYQPDSEDEQEIREILYTTDFYLRVANGRL